MQNQSRREFLKFSGLLVSSFSFFNCASMIQSKATQVDLPNFVVIFLDDVGYGDLSSFGNPTIRTPNLDRMAAEGTKFTQFYVASPVCTPSRAALMTGCYPKRVGLHEGVLFPHSNTGMHPDEITIADMLKNKNYATACIGKWHLGHHPKFLPTRQGFDYFYGIPYSNDMSEKEQKLMGNFDYHYKLPLYRNEEIVEVEPDQTYFTRQFTEEAVSFIRKNKQEPFFLYLAHPMAHIPLYASPEFQGKSTREKYGDTLEEIDWSVGQILGTLKSLDLEKNTLVIFTSDNGPWLQFKTDGGSAGPLRGGKGTTFEGGMREPCIMRWPGVIPSGKICTEIVTTMDILPTFAHLAGIDAPSDRIIDGKNILSLLKEPETAKSPHHYFFYYAKKGGLEAVREGKWKYNIKNGTLYNLHADISEKWDVAEQHPDIVKRLKNVMLDFDAKMDREKRPVGIFKN